MTLRAIGTIVLVPCALALLGSGCDTRVVQPAPRAPAQPAAVPGSGAAGWVLVHHEDFEDLAVLGTPPLWARDTHPDDGPFSDQSAYFAARGIAPPVAYRRSQRFGEDGWLTIESYSRSPDTSFADQIAVVADPGNASNHVLRLRSPEHTDATVVRPTRALPPRYRISLRVGHADFGDGLAAGANGYDGGETAEPWLERDATRQNGFYWLAILDTVPRPHNNVWIHHHRKVVIDSDNHHPPWMEIWDGTRFVSSGQRPVLMMAIDGHPAAQGHPLWGKPFLSLAAGTWQPSGSIRAADSYQPDTWYDVTIERDVADGPTRDHGRFVLEVRGDFVHGGMQTYRGSLPLGEHCVWHYNRPGETARAECIDDTPYAASESAVPQWPASEGWPDYFMFGDPHANYYEGQVYYDDIRLEVWRE
jgi:hypothetical protein